MKNPGKTQSTPKPSKQTTGAPPKVAGRVPRQSTTITSGQKRSSKLKNNAY